MRCSACTGPYSEPTGHILAWPMVLCGPCARHFVAWLKQHTRRKWGGLGFYEYAATSVRPEAE